MFDEKERTHTVDTIVLSSSEALTVGALKRGKLFSPLSMDKLHLIRQRGRHIPAMLMLWDILRISLLTNCLWRTRELVNSSKRILGPANFPFSLNRLYGSIMFTLRSGHGVGSSAHSTMWRRPFSFEMKEHADEVVDNIVLPRLRCLS